jgi:hypothetical protein
LHISAFNAEVMLVCPDVDDQILGRRFSPVLVFRIRQPPGGTTENRLGPWLILPALTTVLRRYILKS